MRTYLYEHLIQQQNYLYNFSDFTRLKEKLLIQTSEKKNTYLTAI